MSETEKADVSHASDEVAQSSLHDPDAHLGEDERLEIERKLVKRLDWILIPWLCVLYLLAFLDRTNIGNAKIAGLNNDLGLSSSQYNSALTIFFVSYAVFEPLTNILLKKLRPSIFIPVIMRVGCHAAHISQAIFFSAAAISGSFGGALAAAIEQMAGVGGRPGWSWIFILEGILTVLFGVASFWMVHDFPDEAKFLSEDDRARVIRRLKMDQQASADHEEFEMTFFWQAVKDWKMWLGMAIYMGCDMPLYAFSLFLPTIVNELGWNTSVVRSQLMTVPPYAVAAVFTVFIGWVADKTQQRGLCNISVSLIGIVGFSMLIATESPQVKYAGTFLGALGIYPCISNTITWVANNVEGVYKRGVVLGFVIGWGNLNGIVSSNIYIREPRFSEGHGVVLAYMSVFLCLGSVLMTLLLRVENQKRRQGKRDHWADNKSEKEIDALGDRRPDFLYTL
ncbi:putative transporter [Colletotrichum tanaceti]|uniref:Putative transporter n=1 Tax=Colletotrichum tanaceti TaxID=1306861 RepID=A0A4V6DG12_9PEZI|nr:putative transporter [Colletotrichum tanaceti]